MFLFDLMKQVTAFGGGGAVPDASTQKKDSPPPAKNAPAAADEEKKADPSALSALFGSFSARGENDDAGIDAAIDEGRGAREEVSSITAAMVPASKFPKEAPSFGGDLRPEGAPDLTTEHVKELAGQKLGKLAPGFAEENGNGSITMKNEKGVTKDVEIVVVDPKRIPEGAVAESKTWDDGTSTIFVSSGTLDDKHVARALAHEFEELRTKSPEHGDADAEPGALKEGAAADARLTAHDRGRVAELRLMLDELATSKSGPDASIEDRMAERRTYMEVDALASHLGLNQKAISNDPDDLAAAKDARQRRLAMVTSMLGNEELGGRPELAAMLEGMLRIDDDAEENQDEGVRMRVLDTQPTLGGLDPGHISATADGVHSSWCGKGNIKPIENERNPAFPGGPDVSHASAKGAYATEENDTYLATPQAGDHVFDPSFINPEDFNDAKEQVERAKEKENAFVLRTFDAPQLDGQVAITTPNGGVKVSETEQGPSVQARNCGTDLVAKLQAQGVLGPADYQMLNMNPDGTYKEGHDLRPQDIMLHLRWREFEHMREKARRDAEAGDFQ